MLRAPCSRCLPDSHKINAPIKLVDISRLQHLPLTQVTGKNVRGHFFGDIRYAWNRRSYSYSQINPDILNCKRIETAITTHVQITNNSGSKTDYQTTLNVATKHYANMRANISDTIIKCVGYILVKALKSLFVRVFSTPAQMEAVKECNLSGIPVVYVPTHMSHFDYILVTWILWNYDIKAPHVASGDNLNFSGFGWLLRCLGAFFIRRKMEDKGAAKDIVYRAVLQSYIENVLCKGYSIEFFPEGARSRFGKVQRPKTGIMSVLRQACKTSVVEDMWLVPVSISYECLMEGVFIEELQGQPKQRESLWQVFVTSFRALNKQHGMARIDFGTPVLFNTFVNGIKQKSSLSSGSHILCSPSTLILETVGRFDYNQTESMISGQEVKAMCDHLVYDCLSYSSVTVTQLVACGLLGRSRNGVPLDDLISDCHWLLSLSNKPLIDNRILIDNDDIYNAVKLLGIDVVIIESSFGDNDSGIGDLQNGEEVSVPPLIRPAYNTPALLQLAYYKNTCMQYIALDCIMAASFLSCVFKENSWVLDRSEFIEQTSFLADLLSFEFIFVAPCESIEEAVNNRLNDSSSKISLYNCTSISSNVTNRSNIEHVQLNDDRSLNRLNLLKKLVDPFLYSYLLTANALCQLSVDGIKEKDFVSCLLNIENASEFTQGTRVPPESVNKNSITNAVYFFTRWGHVTKCDTSDILRLNPAANSVQALREIVKSIEFFTQASPINSDI